MKYCSKCGAELLDEAVICPETIALPVVCGRLLIGCSKADLQKPISPII